MAIKNDYQKWTLSYKRFITLARVMNYAPRVVDYSPRVMLQIVASLTDDSRGASYDRNMFIV